MILPAAIDLANSEKYRLSIRIDSKKFVFTLFDPREARNFHLREIIFEETNESLLEKVQRVIFELNFLTQQYAETNVIFVSPNHQLVPIEYYDVSKKETLFQLSISQDEFFIVENELPKYDSVMLSGVDVELHSFLKRSLYNPHFYNQSTLLIDYFEGRKRTASLYSKMYVNIVDDAIDVICFKENKLLHATTYNELSINDEVYYILKTWESLGLDQLKDELLIAGKIDDLSLSVLRKYVGQIERVTLPSEIYLWHKDAQRTPLDLLSLSL